MRENRGAALERLLKDEREMILAGRLDELQEIAPRKADALSQLPDWQLPADKLAALAAQVNRNQALLDAAIRGMKAARLRIESVIGAAGTLSTYDRSGQKSDLGKARNALTKKA